MKYKNSVAIVRTRKGNTVGCKMIATYRYAKLNKNQFVYDKGYMCKDFEIIETVGGQVIVKTTDKFEFSKANITNRIVFDNVTDIEILTHHDV